MVLPAPGILRRTRKTISSFSYDAGNDPPVLAFEIQGHVLPKYAMIYSTNTHCDGWSWGEWFWSEGDDLDEAEYFVQLGSFYINEAEGEDGYWDYAAEEVRPIAYVNEFETYLAEGGYIYFSLNDPVTVTADSLVIDIVYEAFSPDAKIIGDEEAGTIADAIDGPLPELNEVPPIGATLKQALAWVYTMHRNRRTQDALTETVYADDDTTPIATSVKSDDGSTFTRGKYQ